MTIEKCETCSRYDFEKDKPRNWLYCKFCCDDLIEYENERMAEYETAWLEREEDEQ